jgi:acetoacetyl-CoA synthetase
MCAIPVRIPSDEQVRLARITQFQSWLNQHRGLTFPDYDSLWRWSATDLDAFWDAVREYFSLPFYGRWRAVLADRSMPGAAWYPGARLNYVEQVFRHRTDERPALVCGREDGALRTVGWTELERNVASLAQWLRRHGIGPGDRVVAYLPNVSEAVVAFLAAASVGAVWSICAPDMGSASVLDRFRQIEPRVLIAVDGYVHAGRRFDRTGEVGRLLRELPSLEQLIWLSNLGLPMPDASAVEVAPWENVIDDSAVLAPEHVPFEQPLWIVYSSGTTGLPKAIVHGHGGILLEHVKVAALHFDLAPEDRFFWYSSTGWIMWNLHLSGLLVGATVCTYDGSPAGPDAASPDLNALWRFAAQSGATYFGAGAAYYASCAKGAVEPARGADLSRIRAVGSTGSPLAPEAEHWLYRTLDRQVWVAPISGGTDFASGFVGGVPTVPSYAGEMQVRCLGASVEAWSEAGEPLIDAVGELVCTAPMPSMPLRFWNDPGDLRYRESYFEMFPGVWRHGDWVRIVPHPGAHGSVIYGRSDTTINRHGIRMGTAELYRAVEALSEVLDSLVVDVEYLGRESYMPLFVVLRPGIWLDRALAERMQDAIRQQLSPRHVPSEIVVVTEIPRTLTGKKLELPVKKLLLGLPPEKVLNRDSMANPASIDWYVDFARRHLARAGE